MIRSIFLVPLLFSVAVSGQSSPKAGNPTEAKTVKELVGDLKAREKTLKAAHVEMVTTGSYPGGRDFEVKGVMRVLKGTHIHTKTVASFGKEITTESEVIKTPDGVWTREKDPSHGEVYTHMKPDLMKRLEEASQKIGKEGQGLGQIASQANDLLGSSMLEGLNGQFDLKVDRSMIEGRSYWSVKGPLRAATSDGDQFGIPSADAVELLVRTRDLAVTRMVQFSKGKEFIRVEITRIELDGSMKPESFKIDRPEDKPLIDIMDHAPAAAHIQNILAEAEGAKKDADKDR